MRFEPRDYQRQMVQFVLDHPRANLWADPGLGKTSVTLLALDILRMMGSTAWPALVIAPLRVARDVWPGEAKKWEDFEGLRVQSVVHDKREFKLKALSTPADIYCINYESLPWLAEQLKGEWPFKTVIADECFPAGTSIETPAGRRPIETIAAGDVVATHLGWRPVTSCFTKDVDAFKLVSLTLSNGSQFRVTEEHPIFTDAGWLRAADCEGRRVYRLSDMPGLQDRICSEELDCKIQAAERADSILLAGLPDERLVSVPPRASGTGGENHEKALAHPRASLEQRRGVYGRATRGNEPPSKRSGEKAAETGGQWPRYGAYRGAYLAALAEGICLELRPKVERRRAGVPVALQAGFRQSRNESLFGGRRLVASHEAGATARRQENRDVRVVRVDRVEDSERGRLVPVFNLETEEAHTYFAEGVLVHNCTRLKNFRLRNGGKRAAVLAKAAGKTARWLNLTGTPAPNGLIDLWGQQWFIDKGARLGSTFTAFRDRWFDYNPYRFSTTVKPHAEREIIEAISDVTLSLRASDCFDLPPLTRNVVKVPLTGSARRIYEQFEREMAAEMDGEVVEALNAAALSMKCLQVAAGAVYTQQPDFVEVHDEKLRALDSIVEESGTPVLVSYQFKSDAWRIVEWFKPKGKSPSNAKILTSQSDFDDWNAGKIRVGLVHPDSAGHGLSLQDGGHTLVFYQAWWDLEKHDQVIERLGPTRQMQSGRNCPVIVHYLIAEDTVDEDVMERLRTKRSVQDLLRERVKR